MMLHQQTPYCYDLRVSPWYLHWRLPHLYRFSRRAAPISLIIALDCSVDMWPVVNQSTQADFRHRSQDGRDGGETSIVEKPSLWRGLRNGRHTRGLERDTRTGYWVMFLMEVFFSLRRIQYFARSVSNSFTLPFFLPAQSPLHLPPLILSL